MVAIGDRHVAVGAEVEPKVPPICSSERSNQPIRCLSELRNRTVVMEAVRTRFLTAYDTYALVAKLANALA